MRILIAEDDLSSRMVLTAAVGSLGHECFEAESGEVAWQMIREILPDVLISDWMMPDLDGLELCRRVRSRDAEGYVYVILVTALDSRDDIRAGMEAGVDDYLVKPLDPFQLEMRLLAAERMNVLQRELEQSRSELRAANVVLAEAVLTDGLTGLGNRRRLDEDLRALHAIADRYGRTYSVAMCDIDDFKAYNDAYGHQAGDDVLRKVASAIAGVVRAGDRVYRYGGEEIVVLMPDHGPPGAVGAAARLVETVADLGIVHSGTGAGVVTVSVGLAAHEPGSGDGSDSVVSRADAALYRAKEQGRNRVEMASSATEGGGDS